jgi:hypothetical protein
MIALFFSIVFFTIGYWLRGTKAAVWLNDKFSPKDSE